MSSALIFAPSLGLLTATQSFFASDSTQRPSFSTHKGSKKVYSGSCCGFNQSTSWSKCFIVSYLACSHDQQAAFPRPLGSALCKLLPIAPSLCNSACRELSEPATGTNMEMRVRISSSDISRKECSLPWPAIPSHATTQRCNHCLA